MVSKAKPAQRFRLMVGHRPQKCTHQEQTCLLFHHCIWDSCCSPKWADLLQYTKGVGSKNATTGLNCCSFPVELSFTLPSLTGRPLHARGTLETHQFSHICKCLQSSYPSHPKWRTTKLGGGTSEASQIYVDPYNWNAYFKVGTKGRNGKVPYRTLRGFEETIYSTN